MRCFPVQSKPGLISSQILVVESSAPRGSDPLAMMEYYMKKAAQEEKLRAPKASKDEMPPPASLLQGQDCFLHLFLLYLSET